MTISNELLNKALKRATEDHFCKLFEVLLVSPDEGMGRFQAGVKRLMDTEAAVAQLIARAVAP